MLFKGIGGIDMLFRANVEKERMELIDKPLSNPEHLREGVGIAFFPFLARGE